MSDTYEPNDLAAYLSDPAESPSDAAESEELQTPDPELDDDQSSEDVEEVASPDESEQLDPDETPKDEEAPPEPPAPQAINWDSEDNPYRKEAEELAKLRQFAAQKQAEQEAAKERDRLIEAGKRIVDVDESDLPELMGDFIDEIRESAAEPFLQQINTLNHGMTALVAAVQSLPAKEQEAIKKLAAEFRELGSTSDEIERAFAVSQRERAAATAREQKLLDENTALKAQLAAKKLTASGKNRRETVAVGGGGNDDPQSWKDLLGGGPL